MDPSWSGPICYYFQQGNCRFGNDCHYRHEMADGVSMDTVCWYYQENGWCPHGRNCRFPHIITPYYQYAPTRRTTDQSVCIFYMRGNCRHGTSCSFVHPALDCPSEAYPGDRSPHKLKKKRKPNKPGKKNETNEDNVVSESTETEVNKEDKNPEGISPSSDVPQENTENETENTQPLLSPSDCERLQQRERKMLKQRICGDQLTIKSTADGDEVYEVEYVATDPDWSYDVNSVKLLVSFPKQYPSEPMEVKCLDSDVLPETVVDACNKAIQGWVKQRFENIGRKAEQGDLAFRPFLRWLDRRLEGIFTEGLREYQRVVTLKAYGVTIWTPEKLKKSLACDADGQGDEEDEEEEEEQQQEQEEEGSDEDSSAESEDSDEAAEASRRGAGGQGPLDIDDTPRGVQMRLKHLQLGDQTASVLFLRARLVLQCERCRHNFDLSLRANVPSVADCPRCNSRMAAKFRPMLVHALSSVMGHLDAEACQPQDGAFVEWRYRLTCLKCDHAMDRRDIRPGSMMTVKCLKCFAELRLAFNSLQFQRLAPLETPIDKSNAHHVVFQRQKKAPRDPAIREGHPLPNDGACSHYKKSFRWLRFPCCGKAFPCDVCHDDAATDGHEMVWANRMICGFCCKEQPFSAERPCVMCSKSMTKVSSKYWEGGKGCRNKLAMSRNEVRKYKNENKTISRRAGAKATGSRRSEKSKN